MAEKDKDEGGFKVKPAGPGGFEPAKPTPYKPPEHAKDDEKGPPEHAQNKPKAEPKGHEAAGKSPLRTTPDSRPVDVVAEGKPRKEMRGDEQPQEQLAYSRSIPDPVNPEDAYQNYMVQAITALYPNLRDGQDFVIGRREYGAPMEILHWSDKLQPADQGKIEEVARQMAAQDPNVDYQPQRGLHRGFAPPGTEGEHVPPKEGERRGQQPLREGSRPGQSVPPLEGERPGQVTPAEFAGRKEGSDQPEAPQPPAA